MSASSGTYLQMRDSTMAEPDFLVALARRTGCGLLLDINNAYVSASNHGWSATDYIDAIPGDLVGEVHLAGHAVEEIEDDVLRIDDQILDPTDQPARKLLSNR